MTDPHTLATDRAPVCRAPDPHPRGATRFTVPQGAVDTHAHVIGHPPRYPLVDTRSYTPPEATAQDYMSMLDATGMAYGVLVQVSVHGTDNSCMVDALQVQPHRLRGVCVVGPDVSNEELARLDRAGVRGCRFNLLFGGGIGLDAMETLARRVAPLGWHMQFLLDARDLPELAPRLAGLPVPIVIDHMGHMPAHEGVTHPGFQALLSLVRAGRCWVKLSGAYRLAAPPYGETIAFARALIEARPDRMVWGSDWPHVSFEGPMPNVGDLLDLVADWAPQASLREAILTQNAHQLYGFA